MIVDFILYRSDPGRLLESEYISQFMEQGGSVIGRILGGCGSIGMDIQGQLLLLILGSRNWRHLEGNFSNGVMDGIDEQGPQGSVGQFVPVRRYIAFAAAYPQFHFNIAAPIQCANFQVGIEHHELFGGLADLTGLERTIPAERDGYRIGFKVI